MMNPVTTKQKELQLGETQIVAATIVETLGIVCERIEIVGSIRRKRPWVHDIDLVVIPLGGVIRDKKGTLAPMPGGSRWFDIPRIIADQLPGGKTIKKGTLIITAEVQGIQVDINCANPVNWGILHLLKTGPLEFNIELCNRAKKQGNALKVMSGIWKGGEDGTLLPAATERDIFDALALPFIAPENRDEAVRSLRRGEFPLCPV